MLGGYAVGVPVQRTPAQNHVELDRYLRLEYGGRMNVATLLAEAAQVSRKARMKGPSRLANGIRALAAALRSIARGRQAKIPMSEV
jgi:hypothetical protein